MPTPKKPQAKKPAEPILKPTNRKKLNKQPNSKREEIERDLDSALSLSVLANMVGGQVLLEQLMDDLVVALDTMLADSLVLTHMQILDLLARIRERLGLIRQITCADPEADTLKQVLKEEIEKEKAEREADAKSRPDNGMTDHGQDTP